MNVLHIATTLAGGAGIGLQRYHQSLQKVGVDSRIIVSRQPSQVSPEVRVFDWRKYPLWQRLLRRLNLYRTPADSLASRLGNLHRGHENPGYEVYSLPFSQFTPESHPWVKEADAIVLHWTSTALDWPRFFAKVSQPIILVLHDQNAYLGGFHYIYDRERNPHLAALESEIVALKQKAMRNRRIAVVANSDWNARQARELRFFPSDTSIETIYYPIDSEIYHPRIRDEARLQAKLSNDEFVIGFGCENLQNQRKGFDLLLEVLRRLPAPGDQKLKLLSFGGEPERSLPVNIRFPWQHLGWLNTDQSKAVAYAAMDVFVAPSRAEAFGLTALEAQAVGTPVVASPIDGLVEAVADNPASDFRNESLIDSLSHGLSEFMRSPQDRQDAAQRGRELVQSRHNPELIGSRFRHVIQQVLR